MSLFWRRILIAGGALAGVAIVALLAVIAYVLLSDEDGEPAPQVVQPTPTATPTATPTVAPTGPDLGALQQLADPGAMNLSTREFEVNDETFAELAYDLPERVASPGFGTHGGVVDKDRQYLEVYRWADGSWERAFSLYEFLPAIYPPEELGPIVDSKPQTATAIVAAGLTPVEFEAEIGDVLFLETSLLAGPAGWQHPPPTITALVWSNGEFYIAYSEEFGVRGGMLWVRAEGEYIELAVDAYLTTDPMCCPSGWEMLLLAPTEFGDLWPEERCVAPENTSCLQ